ncbi:hypothetical protein BDK51DRAFT_28006, partial [Blyttiomyces helicus]
MSDPAKRPTEPEEAGPTLYVCELQGHDIEGDGSKKMPFATSLRALSSTPAGKADLHVRKVLADGFQPIAKAAFKKAQKAWETEKKKAQKAAERAEAEARDAEKNAAAEAAKLEEAKKIVLELDASLPVAKK